MARHAALLCAFLLIALCHVASVTAADKTNVIIILADDLGYGDLGCYGHPRFKTPRLDRMAAEGVRFTHFQTPVPYCAPTRAALLTGRYPWRFGLTRNPTPDANPPVDDVGMPASEVTLAEAFRGAGYATACIGKWHLGHRPEFYPTRHGFDEYLGILYSNDMRPVRLIDGEKSVEYPVVQATLTKRYTQRAQAFIEKHKDRPFFLYLPHAMPHKPLAISEDFYKRSGAGLYGDVMAELDWSIGQMLDKLTQLDLDRRTLVVFTSDNGPWFGGSTGGLRGMKGTTWEGGLRVPMIARWPGKLPAGRTVNVPCGTIDIFPTVLAAAGIAPPKDVKLDGVDLMPWLAGSAAKERDPHEALFGQSGQQLRCVRSGRWKLHVRTPGPAKAVKDAKWIDPRAPDGVTLLAPYEQYRPSDFPGATSGDEPGEMMLFDLAADPSEQRNVAGKHPDTVRQLKALFDAMDNELSPRRAKKKS